MEIIFNSKWGKLNDSDNILCIFYTISMTHELERSPWSLIKLIMHIFRAMRQSMTISIQPWLENRRIHVDRRHRNQCPICSFTYAVALFKWWLWMTMIYGWINSLKNDLPCSLSLNFFPVSKLMCEITIDKSVP